MDEIASSLTLLAKTKREFCVIASDCLINKG